MAAYYGVPLGTVISSVLNYNDFAQSIAITPPLSNPPLESLIFDPNTSTYSPCDGRPIVGSKLQRTFGTWHHAPDLRGQFIRGLNDMWSDGQAPLINPERKDRDPNPRTQSGQYQPDTIKNHNHLITGRFQQAHNGTDFLGMGLDSNSMIEGENDEDAERLINHNPYRTDGLSDASTDNRETRPQNMSVYYYIRINY